MNKKSTENSFSLMRGDRGQDSDLSCKDLNIVIDSL